MKKSMLFLVFLILAAVQSPALAAAPGFTVQDIKNGRNLAVQFIDIRKPHQYIGWDTEQSPGGHIAGAMDLPEYWLGLGNRIDIGSELKRRNIDLTIKTVIYADDTVSDQTYQRYKSLGFTHLYVLEGGFKAYSQAKLPVQKLPGYQMLVHPQWVEDLIQGKKPATYANNRYVILEFVFDPELKEYKQGHIPGAVIAEDSINEIPGPRTVAEVNAYPPSEQIKLYNKPDDAFIKAKLEAMGITADTTVILYANDTATTAAYRCGMVLRYAGVKDIRFLNGGRTLWTLEKRPVEQGENAWKPVADFGDPVPAPGKKEFIDYADEAALVDSPGAVIASVRSWPEYLCAISGYTYIAEAGDIPNSRFAYAGSDPYAMEDYRNPDNTMFNYHVMAQRWALWGITPDKIVSFHCGTGWRASETFFYAAAMGWPEIRVYAGSWYEWHKTPGSGRKAAGLPDGAPETTPRSFFNSKK